MATSMYLRRMKRLEAMTTPTAVKPELTPELTFGERSAKAWEIVKSGEASNIKEAWKILKLRENGSV